MTGLEMLKEEMLKRGCNKAQVNSKVIPVVLDIVSESGSIYQATEQDISRLRQLDHDISLRRSTKKLLEDEIERLRAELKMLRNDSNIAFKVVAKDVIEYIESFYKALENMETPEGRDRLKAAQVFVNSVNVDTKYDNTAFIVALGSLLSGISYSPINELKKINPKINTERGRLSRL